MGEIAETTSNCAVRELKCMVFYMIKRKINMVITVSQVLYNLCTRMYECIIYIFYFEILKLIYLYKRIACFIVCICIGIINRGTRSLTINTGMILTLFLFCTPQAPHLYIFFFLVLSVIVLIVPKLFMRVCRMVHHLGREHQIVVACPFFFSSSSFFLSFLHIFDVVPVPIAWPWTA